MMFKSTGIEPLSEDELEQECFLNLKFIMYSVPFLNNNNNSLSVGQSHGLCTPFPVVVNKKKTLSSTIDDMHYKTLFQTSPLPQPD